MFGISDDVFEGAILIYYIDSAIDSCVDFHDFAVQLLSHVPAASGMLDMCAVGSCFCSTDMHSTCVQGPHCKLSIFNSSLTDSRTSC